MIRKVTAAITTTSGGAATVYVGPVSGLVQALYVGQGTLAATSDLTITDSGSGGPIITITDSSASAWYAPRMATCDVAGAASLYASGGEPVEDRIPVDGEIKIVVAQGGNTTSGTVTFFVMEEW